MAIIDGENLRGSIGEMVFKVVNGIQVVSSKPRKGRKYKAEATLKAADTFGMASALGKNIRLQFSPWLKGLYDSEMPNRISNAVLKSIIPCRDANTQKFSFNIDSFNKLNNLDFNKLSSLNTSLGFDPLVTYADGKIKISRPALAEGVELKFPRGSIGCEVTVSAAWFQLANGKKCYSAAYKSIDIAKTSPEISSFQFEFDAPDGTLCVISTFLRYYNRVMGKHVLVIQKKFSPAAINGAMYIPGIYKGRNNITWIEMVNLKFEMD